MFPCLFDDFLFFSGFLSSVTYSFIICGDFNVHVVINCMDQRKFLDLIDISNFVQSVNQPIHLHGHILDLILTLSDSAFVSIMTNGNLVADHALVKCHLDFVCPTIPMGLSTVSIKIPQIGKHPVYYNSNNQSFPPVFIGAILNYKNVAIFRDIFVNIIAF